MKFQRAFLAVSSATMLAALSAWAAPPEQDMGKLQVKIQAPLDGQAFLRGEGRVDVEGMASVYGGVKYLDLFLSVDSSDSLRRTDPRNFRGSGAAALIRSLSSKSSIHIGVVDFDGRARLLQLLTPDREAAAAAVEALDQEGGTNIADGILKALDGFAQSGREGSTRVILLFTDGKSDTQEAMAAARAALEQGVVVHALQLGEAEKGGELLRDIAALTGGQHVIVDDPAELPAAFRNLRTTGIDKVEISVNGGAAIPAELAGGSFSAKAPVSLGENRITATAVSLDGRTIQDSVTVTVGGEMRAAILSPLAGTLLTQGEEAVDVRGYASMFEGLTSPPAAYPTMGTKDVALFVNGKGPFETYLTGGAFVGRVPLREGENRIEAVATGVDGRSAAAEVSVTVRPRGCGLFRLAAMRNGKPALSISDRVVEVILDASGSMWAQIEGKSRMEIAKETLSSTLAWLPEDLALALRIYGHQSAREKKDCTDSQLAIAPGLGNREAVREAVMNVTPKGQTPLALSIEAVKGDLAAFAGEKGAILLTDGIESCNGDPVAAARSLQGEGGPVTVHVIGFNLGKVDEAALNALKGVAEVSGGLFLTAENAESLREALAATAGTSWKVLRGDAVAASGVLGSDAGIALPEGDYLLRVESRPPYELNFRMNAGEDLSLVLDRGAGGIAPQETRQPAEYRPCPEASAEPAPSARELNP